MMLRVMMLRVMMLMLVVMVKMLMVMNDDNEVDDHIDDDVFFLFL